MAAANHQSTWMLAEAWTSPGRVRSNGKYDLFQDGQSVQSRRGVSRDRFQHSLPGDPVDLAVERQRRDGIAVAGGQIPVEGGDRFSLGRARQKAAYRQARGQALRISQYTKEVNGSTILDDSTHFQA